MNATATFETCRETGDAVLKRNVRVKLHNGRYYLIIDVNNQFPEYVGLRMCVYAVNPATRSLNNRRRSTRGAKVITELMVS